MNQFAILYPMALFSIPFIQPQEYRKVRCQIKEARIYDRVYKTSRTFSNGDVYLYETIDVGIEGLAEKAFVVGDNSGEFSHEFDIAQYNTVVTEDGITIKSYCLTMYISTLDGDNIAFYQNLFPLEDFDHEFPVTRVVRGGETLESVFAVKAKEDDYGEWILAVVDNNAPRLVIPCRYVNWTQEYEDIDKGVSFVIAYEPQGKKMTVEFDRWTAAKTFYAFVDSRPTYYFLQ